MARKKKIILGLFVCLAIFSALTIFLGLRDIPLPKNAKNVGGMIHIDISDALAGGRPSKDLLFVIPESFKPEVVERAFVFFLKYTDGSPYTGNESPRPNDRVLVIVEHIAPGRSKSEFALRRTQPKNGLLKNVPYFVEDRNGVEVYEYDFGSNEPTMGSYFSFTSEEGIKVLVQDPGRSSVNYRIYRKLTDNIEINYHCSKNLIHDSKSFISDVMRIDKAVTKAVRSFQSN